jgi:PAS domain S-box-containing protein
MQVGVILQGPQAEIVFSNPMALELLGLTEDQLLGRTSFDPDWNVIHEDGSPFPGHTHPVPQAIASRSPVRGIVMGVCRPRQGDRVWLLVDAEPRLNEKGMVNEIVCSFIDISDRKRAEAALHETNAYLENLFDHANAPIIVWDPRFRITRFNHAFEFLTGRLEAEVLGLSPEILFPRELADDSMALLGRTLTGQRWESVEIKILHRGGSIRTVLWNSATLFERDGTTPIATIAQGQDITERKLAEEALRASTAKLEDFNSQLESTVARRTAELQASNKELESFAYSISHDLRAPLRAMEGFSDRLLKKLGDSIDGESIHHLERIRTASRRMGLLINDLLSLSQVTRLGFTNSVVDLNLIASQILLRFSLMHPERKVQSQLMPGLSGLGDERLLTILMEHLLDNAWKFTACRETGLIVVGSRPLDGREVYFIQDNGSGFDMAWGEQLFKPFMKLEGIESSSGTGIGLVTAAKIVERHGGRIWAESSPDAGATFYFTLAP